MTNYDIIKSMSIEDMSISRIDRIDCYVTRSIADVGEMWVGDFGGVAESEEEAFEKEVEWLKKIV